MTRVLISCGEASGDLYAAALAQELRQLEPGIEIAGLGGPRLAAAGATLLDDYRRYSVTGLAEVLRQLPRTWALYKRLAAHAATWRPDVFVPIDFPDFNFKLGSAIAGQGVPVVYYISPQLWAWRAGRLKTMKRFVSLVLPIFPFEEPLYREAGVPVEFVGHPLIDLVHVSRTREVLLRDTGLDPDRPVLALLPGSRPNELRAILPDLVAGAEIIARSRPDVQFLLARAPNLDEHLLESAAAARDAGRLRLAILEGATDDVLAAADVVVTASGTATVQTALHEKPMVIVYRVSGLSYFIGRRFVRVDTFGMANLIAGRRVAAELIQTDFTPAAVAAEADRLLRDRDAAEAMRREWREVKVRLGGPGASRRAAEAILRVVRRRTSSGAAATAPASPA
ncbi:MAG TPA: lipid-A-disaccharide synthase [Vicinamibacterales bacterium]